ncbi:MAG: PEP-CTERM sorting domain-containing protein [Gammaproteobacteria bacterium]|jgi:hypothetical protein
MKKRLIQILGAFAVTFAAGGAQAIPLTDLLAGQSVTAGDKQFDNFTVTFQDTSDLHTVNTDNIDVTALNDGGLDPGPGLQFNILNSEFNVTGDDIYAYTDFEFSYHVTVLDPTLKIKDISLGNYGASLSYTADGSNDLGSSIVEWAGTAPGLDDLVSYGSLTNELSVLDNAPTSNLSASANFAPQSDIWVTKDILVWSIDSTDTAGLQTFTQRFSQQTIPEPGTMFLLAPAVVGLLAMRRKGKR